MLTFASEMTAETIIVWLWSPSLGPSVKQEFECVETLAPKHKEPVRHVRRLLEQTDWENTPLRIDQIDHLFGNDSLNEWTVLLCFSFWVFNWKILPACTRGSRGHNSLSTFTSSPVWAWAADWWGFKSESAVNFSSSSGCQSRSDKWLFYRP